MAVPGPEVETLQGKHQKWVGRMRVLLKPASLESPSTEGLESLMVVVLKGIMSAGPLPFLAPWLRPGAVKKSEKLMAWLRSSLPPWLQHGQTKGHVTSGSGRRQIPP